MHGLMVTYNKLPIGIIEVKEQCSMDAICVLCHSGM